MAEPKRPRDKDWERLGVNWLGERARLAHAAWLQAGEEGEGRIIIHKKLSKARLDGLKLEAIEGRGAFVQKVNFVGTSFERGRFVDCDFDEVNFLMANLSDTVWENCEFRGAMAGASYWDRARLVRCHFSGGGELSRSRWRQARLDTVCFVSMDGQRMKFEETRFSNCVFRDMDMRQAIFRDVALAEAQGLLLERCDLRAVSWGNWPLGPDGLPEVDGLRCVDCRVDDS